jgi:hypothetical protein
MTEQDAGERGLPALMRKLRSDPGFRKRFAQAISTTLRDFDIDPSSFAATEEIGEDQIAQFLSDWAGGAGPDDWRGPNVPVTRQNSAGVGPLDTGREEEFGRFDAARDMASQAPLSNVVYGPPPGARERAITPPSDRKASPPGGEDLGAPEIVKPSPPAPVYGPPPGRSWLRRLFPRGGG